MLELNLKKYHKDGFIIIKKGITENLLLSFYKEIEKFLLLKFPNYSKLFQDEKINLRVPKLLSLAEGDDPDKFYQLCIDCTRLPSFSMPDISEEFKEILFFFWRVILIKFFAIFIILFL